ncbi:MAG: InlB B-repeat-containing protein, partial [Bacillota bacterium]
MKKILSLITLFFAPFALIGCEVTPEDPDPETYTITLESSYEDATLSQTPDGPHEEGDEVEISTSWEDESYQFVAWQDGDDVLSEEATFTHTVEDDVTLEAVFEEESDDPETYTLNVDANVSDVDFTFDPEGPYEAGDTVNITPDYDDTVYQFVEWVEGDAQISTNEALEYTVEADATLEAVFEEITAEPATYTETFEDLPVSGSTYESDTFTGVNDVEWAYTDVRGDKTLEGSKAATLSKNDSNHEPHVSATIEEGIRSFSVEFTNPFQTPAQLELFIDGESVGVSDEVDGEVGVFEVEDLDVSGEFDLELRATNGQTTIDNLTWENNVAGSDDPEVSVDSAYWDADLSIDPSDKEPAGTEITVNASDPNEEYSFLRWE